MTEIIRELEELLEEKDDWKEEGIILQCESIEYAITFAGNSIEPGKLKKPNIEVHPDVKEGEK